MSTAEIAYDNQDKEILANSAEYIAETKKTIPNIIFYITRSKNRNLVLYEAMFDGEALNHKAAVDAYWHDVEPSYVAANRKKGITNDRCDLNLIERKMAYGISATADAANPGQYILHLVALPSRPVTLKLVDGRPVAVTEINGRACHLTHIFVKSQERTFLPPKCIYVDVYGTDAETGEIVKEQLVQ